MSTGLRSQSMARTNGHRRLFFTAERIAISALRATMSKPRVLLQLDTDLQPSVFDAVVAIDSGVDQVLRHGGVTAEGVRELVYGAIFTRGGEDLRHTAIMIGGSDVAAGEALAKAVTSSFFGPLRVSVLLDSNGANTTAAAAVLCSEKHVSLTSTTALVLGATGPVGQRVVRLLARRGAIVRAGSRSIDRARAVCESVGSQIEEAQLVPTEAGDQEQITAALADAQLVIAAGAAGAQFASGDTLSRAPQLKVAVDLNAVPPAGLEAVEATDRGQEREGVICYGAIGVGGTKMKIHKAAIRRLFEANDQVLDAEEIYEIGQKLDS